MLQSWLQQELERKEEEEWALRKPKDFIPSSNYREKYEHLIGREAAKEAARKTQTNKQYGFGMLLHECITQVIYKKEIQLLEVYVMPSRGISYILKTQNFQLGCTLLFRELVDCFS